MTSQSKTLWRSRASLFTLVPLALILSAFNPSDSYLGYAHNNGAALSADGRTALVGATYAPVGATYDAGKAFIYHYSNGH